MLRGAVLWAGVNVAALAAEGPQLTPGAHEVAFSRGQSSWTGQVVLPEGAAALAVQAAGEEDLRLQVRAPGTGRWFAAQGVDGGGCLAWGVAGFPEPEAGIWEVRLTRAGRRPGTVALHVADEAMAARRLWNEERALPANDPEDGVEGRLLDGVSLPIVVPAQPGYLTFVVEVPRSVKDLTLDLVSPQHGLELYAKWGGLIEDFAEEGLAEASAKTLDERLRLGRNGDFPLGAGRWYVDVYNPFQDDRPAVLSLAFEASEALAFEEVPTPLQVGVPAGFSIAGPDRRHAAFVLQVPEGAEELRLQVVGAATDLDLYVRAAEPMRSWEEATWSGIAPTGHEVLVLTPSDGLVGGPLFVDVVTASKDEPPTSATLLATLDGVPAVEHPTLALPVFRVLDDASTWERVAAATVRVTGADGTGSGIVVDPRGLVLTACHVIDEEEVDDPVGSEVVIALSVRPDETPRELLFAEVIAADTEDDLALLRVTGDVFGRALPAGFKLPFQARGDPATLRLGDALVTGGYPAVASRNSVPTFTMTQGIVSGFERAADGALAWIKTDARMNSGASGGPVVNAAGEVVGVVNESRWEEDDVLWFSRPVSLVPEAWWTLAEAALEAASLSAVQSPRTE